MATVANRCWLMDAKDAWWWMLKPVRIIGSISLTHLNSSGSSAAPLKVPSLLSSMARISDEWRKRTKSCKGHFSNNLNCNSCTEASLIFYLSHLNASFLLHRILANVPELSSVTIIFSIILNFSLPRILRVSRILMYDTFSFSCFVFIITTIFSFYSFFFYSFSSSFSFPLSCQFQFYSNSLISYCSQGIEQKISYFIQNSLNYPSTVFISSQRKTFSDIQK